MKTPFHPLNSIPGPNLMTVNEIGVFIQISKVAIFSTTITPAYQQSKNTPTISFDRNLAL